MTACREGAGLLGLPRCQPEGLAGSRVTQPPSRLQPNLPNPGAESRVPSPGCRWVSRVLPRAPRGYSRQYLATSFNDKAGALLCSRQ